MKIISKQSIGNIEKSIFWAKLRTSPEAYFPDDSEKLFRRCRIFSTVLYLVRTKNIKQVRDTFPQGFKKKNSPASTQQVSVALAPGKGVIEGGPALVSQEERHLIFIFNMDILYSLVNVSFSLIIKADVQCMFDRPQTDYFS